jgi:hypothetical protein
MIPHILIHLNILCFFFFGVIILRYCLKENKTLVDCCLENETSLSFFFFETKYLVVKPNVRCFI